MRKSRIRRTSKAPISKIQRQIWLLCKQLIRKRDGSTCYTCGATGLSGSNQQTGHMWAKASLGAYLKYDLRVLKIQCARCNLFLGGMGAEFYKRMLSEIGPEKMAQLEKDRLVIVKAYDWYVKVLAEYKTLC